MSADQLHDLIRQNAIEQGCTLHDKQYEIKHAGSRIATVRSTNLNNSVVIQGCDTLRPSQLSILRSLIPRYHYLMSNMVVYFQQSRGHIYNVCAMCGEKSLASNMYWQREVDCRCDKDRSALQAMIPIARGWLLVGPHCGLLADAARHIAHFVIALGLQGAR